MAIENKEQFATNVYYDRTFDCDAAKINPDGKEVTLIKRKC